MKTTLLLALLCAALLGERLSARVIDNFNDNAKSDWTDFTFTPNFGLPKEQNGQFIFEQPPAGQAIFSASVKTSETFELKEGRTIEFRADIVKAGEKDSFAVMSFLPTGNSPGTLAGYGIAKSTTDILILKGINKYFFNENPAEAVKNENITLVLSLTGSGGSVIIRAQVLDKDKNNEVIFDKTVVDTPAADVLANGQDSPAAPYLMTGNFALYCYQDFDPRAPEDPYRVIYDNAEVFITDTAVLDDFDDNAKTDWTDFTFTPNFGLPKEQNGRFVFEQPPAGRAIFSASVKTSRTFDLKEGERLRISVDLVQGGEKDSFALLTFMPAGQSPGTLTGYGIAKSTTDILITKGINKYFFNENPAEAIKNENVTLALTLTGLGGSVIINAQVLDKDKNNAVLFDKTVVDTPAADVLADGQDNPAAPFLASGNVVLYCYQDFDARAPEDPYRVVYDNLRVAAPPVAGNTAPIITDLQPLEFGNFLPASTAVSFKVTDDKPLADEQISLTLNGEVITKANGLVLGGAPTARTASYAGLKADVSYTALIKVVDANNAATSAELYFDTFAKGRFQIEIEDYNFDGGKFITNPAPIAEGSGPKSNAYASQVGAPGVDYFDTRDTPRAQDALYRPDDPVRMQHTLDYARDKFTAAGGANANVFDFEVGDIAEGEWLNYTREFAAGSYEVYLRQALANIASAESVLELVTGDPTKANQTTQVLGSFLGVRSGFKLRNTPLTDGLGKSKIVVRLSGKQTLRLRQVTPNPADGSRLQNYMIFLPVADQGPQRATVASTAPAPGSTQNTVAPSIRVELQNRDTKVDSKSVVLVVNGQTVKPTISATAGGAVVTYSLSPLPASGQANTAKLTYKDDQGTELSSEWSFVVNYKQLDPANARPGPGGERGFGVRMAQGDPAAVPRENSLDQAEGILAGRYALVMDTKVSRQVINMNKAAGGSAGHFADDETVPGLFDDKGEPLANGDSDFAVESLAWLDLAPGVYRFGAFTDDGFKASSGAHFADLSSAAVIGFWNGGPATDAAKGEFDFVVTKAGFYPFRFLWYERGGAAYGEFFSVNLATGERLLINDPANASAVKAYRTLAAGAPLAIVNVRSVGQTFAFDFATQAGTKYLVEESDALTAWKPSQEVTGDGVSKTFTAPRAAAGRKFFRVRRP